jgi:F-type H+-transporting ATPase subunit b
VLRAALSLSVMLPFFLAVTEAAQEAGALAKFGVQWKYVVTQIISFLILFGVLYKFGIKPTIATMEERNKKIGDGLRYTEEMQTKLAASHQESAALVKTAQ